MYKTLRNYPDPSGHWDEAKELTITNQPQTQLKLTPEQRRAKQLARKERIETFRVRGETRGWQIKSSAGMPAWQWVTGGTFQPINSKENS